jgi:hypothetical protein
MHFGLGTNVDVGGSIWPNIHMDGVILEPTVYVHAEMRITEWTLTQTSRRISNIVEAVQP